MVPYLVTEAIAGKDACAAAGVRLTSRRPASRDILGLVDRHLLVFFMGLFVVNHALAAGRLWLLTLGPRP